MNAKQSPITPSRPASGFTLTELLVVIVIIIILAALSFVGVRTMRQSSLATQCVENLRTWGIAIHGHASDNSGLVPWSNWASISHDCRFYETHLGGERDSASATMDGKSVLSTQLRRRCPGQKGVGNGNGPVGYAMTRPNPKVPNVGSFNLSSASDASQLLLMIDAKSLNLNGPGDFPTAVLPLTRGSDQRHRQMINALFGDGHVTAYSAANLSASDAKNKAMLDRWFTLR